MNDSPHSNALPEKVMRRHAEMLAELLPAIRELVINEGRPADNLLSRHLRNHKELGSRDRRFLSQAVFSCFRWYNWTVAKLNLSVSEACLIGAALDHDELAPSFRYLEGRCKLPCPVEPLGSKTLDEKRDTLNEWFKDTEDFEPLKNSDLVLEEFGELIAADKTEQCISEFQGRPPTWLRCRSDVAEFTAELTKNNISFNVHPANSAAIAVPGSTNLNPLSSVAAKYVIQDLSSQCVAQIAAPQKGGDWWDCCAGAGGKALHLMDLMGEGKVLATDTRGPALQELKKRARKLGIRGIRVQSHNAVRDEPFHKTFDGVLVDAPCSGWGTWARNPDARLRTSRKDVMQNSNRQVNILKNVAWCVKHGGVLVYAVCTVTQPETEEVVSKFLEEKPEFKLEPFANPLTGEMTDGTLQLWPDAHDGMFIARFVRSEN